MHYHIPRKHLGRTLPRRKAPAARVADEPSPQLLPDTWRSRRRPASDLHSDDGYEHVLTNYDLPNGERPQRGYAYHRWDCAGEGEVPGEEGVCRVEAYIAGTNKRNTYNYDAYESNEYCTLGR